MNKTDIKISSTAPNGDSMTTTVSDVNPAASNLTLKTFAQKLNMLTNNTYGETNKVTTVTVDTNDDKPTPTLKLMTGESGGSEATTITANGETSYHTDYNGDGEIYVRVKALQTAGIVDYGYAGTVQTMHKTYKFTASSGVVYEFHATETDNYKAVTVEYTVA